MIQGLIFDLDRCVFDTLSLGEDILDPVAEPIFDSNLPEEIKKAAAAALWHTAYEDVFTQYNIPASLAEAVRVEARKLTVPAGRAIKTYGDETYLEALPQKKILVTTGFTAFQQSKIDRLGIAHLFDEILIDSVDDLPARKGKQKIFESVLRMHEWQPMDVLVIGDNPRSELGAGRALGIKTVQTLRPGIAAWDEADYHIESFSELGDIIKNA